MTTEPNPTEQKNQKPKVIRQAGASDLLVGRSGIFQRHCLARHAGLRGAEVSAYLTLVPSL